MNLLANLKYIKQNRFYLILTGDAVSTLGNWLTIVALIILGFDKTGSALGVSIVLLLRTVPAFIMGIFSGTIVDRFDKKRIMVVSIILRGLAVCFLIFNNHIYAVYTVAFLASIFGSLFNPALESSIPDIVENEGIEVANSFITIERMIAMIAGPAFAAICIKHLGIRITFLIDGMTFFLFAVVILFMSSKILKHNEDRPKNHFFADVATGLKYVSSKSRLIFLFISYFVASTAMGALGTLELPYCIEYLNLESSVYGNIVAISGSGAVLGSLIFFKFDKIKLLYRYLIGALMFGLGIFMFSFQSVLILAVPFLMMEGLGEAFYSTGIRAYLQKNCPKNILGKIMSYRNLMETSGLATGMVIAGFITRFISTNLALRLFGFVLVVVAIGLIIQYMFSCKRCDEKIPVLSNRGQV